MKVLVLNCGSSSIKYQFIDVEEKLVLAKGAIERIGTSSAILTHSRHDGDSIKITGEILDHNIAIEYVLAVLLSKNHGVIKDKNEIEAVGHRVVHGGEDFAESVLITNTVIKTIQDNFELAPLHNPPNLKGIIACQNHLPGIPQCGVFDTAFHQQMPPKAFLYGIPYQLYKAHKIRRYGFHGTSHLYVTQRTAEFLEKSAESLKIITCHLGNGCSMAAIDKGVSIDTTMGFTPIEGLLMGTRSGDIDASIPLHIMAKEGLTLAEITTMLNKHSGLIGISGVSNDMRELIKSVNEGNIRAKHAFEIFCYRIKKYIGGYIAALGGVDAIVFTGGIGENSSEVRKEILTGMEYFGIELDETKNLNTNGEREISSPGSKVKALVIPTNEELIIALDTAKIVSEIKEQMN
ncbi:MAG: acetate kinase [Ignavibacteria bacterium]|nr:acetate kinase [Ignavibacteria bacterium]